MRHALRDGIAIAVVGILIGLGFAYAQGPKSSSYMPVVITEDFAATMAKMKAAKADVMKRQRDLLNARYDLRDRQRAAYFDGDPVIATKKGVNILERGSQVHFMTEVQELLDFPPAPKLGIDGKLDPAKATDAERRGQALFFGKAQCATCHPAPYYTDNLMHNLRTERFFRPQMIYSRMAAMDGPIKTFPLRGIKDSPPYLHDGRLLTLDDTVEFFNLALGVKLTEPEKKDLVTFLRAL